jgi:hypothetical protein
MVRDLFAVKEIQSTFFIDGQSPMLAPTICGYVKQPTDMLYFNFNGYWNCGLLAAHFGLPHTRTGYFHFVETKTNYS